MKGTCHFGHKVGDKVYLDGKKIRGDVCYWALSAILPRIIAMRFDAKLHWVKNDVDYGCCSDPKNLVIFEIKRIRK